MELGYNGQAYHGWQTQPGDTTVQETVENALSTLLRKRIQVVGCGRTDAGVHASQFFLHFVYLFLLVLYQVQNYKIKSILGTSALGLIDLTSKQ